MSQSNLKLMLQRVKPRMVRPVGIAMAGIDQSVNVLPQAPMIADDDDDFKEDVAKSRPAARKAGAGRQAAAKSKRKRKQQVLSDSGKSHTWVCPQSFKLNAYPPLNFFNFLCGQKCGGLLDYFTHPPTPNFRFWR